MGSGDMRQILLAFTLSFFVSGCASINELPQAASEIDFNQTKEGRTGWSKYEEVFFFRGVDKRTAYFAGKAGMADAGFTIKRADYEKAFIIGEHGITKYDWNVIAGLYIKCFVHYPYSEYIHAL